MMATMHLAVTLFAGDITQDLEAGGRSFMAGSHFSRIPAVTWCAVPYHRAALVPGARRNPRCHGFGGPYQWLRH